MKNNEVQKIVEQCISIPQGYKLSSHGEVTHDKLPVMYARFTKNPDKKEDLFVEHFSVTIDRKNNRLMGVMYLDRCFDDQRYIDEGQAEEIALNFIKENAKDLLDTLEIRWIRPTRKIPQSPPHDEGFKLKSGEIITGMRVKMWANNTKKYAWVIVGVNGQIINFERDIVWSTLRHRRTTEKWLHDDWLAENNIDLS